MSSIPVARAVPYEDYDRKYLKATASDIENQLYLPKDVPTSSDLMAKTYALISAQLFCTACVSTYIYLNFRDAAALVHLSTIGNIGVFSMFALMFTLFCTRGITKLIVSLLFSVATGCIVGCVVIRYEVSIIMQAMLITIGITSFCSLYVILSKSALHSWKGVLSASLWGLVLTGLVFRIFPPSAVADAAYTVLGIIVFTGFILVDTSQLIRPHRYDEDEYIDIAVNIYLDIINIFLKLLKLLGSKKNRR
jgi:FtsH-binding integral membrane protein